MKSDKIIAKCYQGISIEYGFERLLNFFSGFSNQKATDVSPALGGAWDWAVN